MSIEIRHPSNQYVESIPVDQWLDPETSEPFDDVRIAFSHYYRATGVGASVLRLTPFAAGLILASASFQNLYIYTGKDAQHSCGLPKSIRGLHVELTTTPVSAQESKLLLNWMRQGRSWRHDMFIAYMIDNNLMV